MSEAPPEAPEAPAPDQQADSQGNPGDEALGDAGKQALDRMKAERNEARQRAKALEAEVEKIRKSSMTEAEKAVAEAEARGRTAATQEFGQELARERFDALAGRRNPDFDTAQALEYVDLAKFLGEDGRPDAKAIKAAVERLVPAPPSGPPSFDGGARTAAPAAESMTGLIRKAAGRA